MSLRIGIGYDSHCFADGGKLVLGGVVIPHSCGLKAHSDGDVLCHAIIDAILGALGAGDIGKHFPDTDLRWKDAVSTELLRHVISLVQTAGFVISWIDSVVITEQPKLAPHLEAMKSSLAAAGIPPDCINIKAKTNEKMGFIGRGEGIAAQAVCLLTQSCRG
ncbi:MAG TPA: 2-C-methyl-D-erythritol 2,4-cyclodiphosphate synthase [Dissulfurispiraceae bacterium]|nr:2-C-methyl-D-erythritol 2,4-cyclodiphosphate synthase [Dissulfurispiraceae bacterium]